MLLTPCPFSMFRRLHIAVSSSPCAWETEFTPCTGITAVVRQERRYFGGRGIMIAPWQSRMPAAKAALDQGRVVDLESPFSIAGPCADGAQVRVLMTRPDELMPLIYLDVEGAFQGLPTPYDTPGLAPTPWSSERQSRSSFPGPGPRAVSSSGEPTGRWFPP